MKRLFNIKALVFFVVFPMAACTFELYKPVEPRKCPPEKKNPKNQSVTHHVVILEAVIT